MATARMKNAASPQRRAQASKPAPGRAPGREKPPGAPDASLRGEFVFAALRNESATAACSPATVWSRPRSRSGWA